ncbi:MAG: YbjQ family protein [Rhodobacteraceae bacterium]|nr:MAG: YbjQ family protein [Paracoccaceae bacterium]
MANCTRCGRVIGMFAGSLNGVCLDCVAELDQERTRKKEQEASELRARLSKIILTTETAHNLPVSERLGIVASEYVLGMNLFRDFATGVRDIVGGRSETMQRGLREAREGAMEDLRAQAEALGADAVVGIDLDYGEISGGSKNMLLLVASGTAVSLEKEGSLDA